MDDDDDDDDDDAGAGDCTNVQSVKINGLLVRRTARNPSCRCFAGEICPESYSLTSNTGCAIAEAVGTSAAPCSPACAGTAGINNCSACCSHAGCSVRPCWPEISCVTSWCCSRCDLYRGSSGSARDNRGAEHSLLPLNSAFSAAFPMRVECNDSAPSVSPG